MASDLISAEGVYRSFRTGFLLKRTQVLRDVSFNVKKGSVFAILGPNGAGKTTMIKLVAGLGRPDRGTVKVQGVDCHKRRARHVLGFMPERPYFYDHLTGGQLLFFFAQLSGMSRRETEKKTDEVLEKVGLSHAKETELMRYSKGMLQRVGIAQAIIHDPELLVLDEPMSGLDPRGRKEIRDLLKELNKSGKTLFFSSHLLEDVEALCDELIMLRSGRTVAQGSYRKFVDVSEIRFEVVVTKLSQANFEKLDGVENFHPVPEGFRALVLGEENCNSFVSSVLKNGGGVSSLRPTLPVLDDLFSRDETNELRSFHAKLEDRAE